MRDDDRDLAAILARDQQRLAWIQRRMGAYRRRLLVEAEHHSNPMWTGPDDLDWYLQCLREDLLCWAHADRADDRVDELVRTIHSLDRKRRGER